MPMFVEPDAALVVDLALDFFVLSIDTLTVELTPLLALSPFLLCAGCPVVSGELRDSLLIVVTSFTVICVSVGIFGNFMPEFLSTDDDIIVSGLLLLCLLPSLVCIELLLLLPPAADDEMLDIGAEVELDVVFVITLVGMGLNTSFAVVGLRGSVSSFVSIGLRSAFGPCCALDAVLLLANGDVLPVMALVALCLLCKYASGLKSLFGNGSGGVFDGFAFGLLTADDDDDGALFVPNALYIEFRYDE